MFFILVWMVLSSYSKKVFYIGSLFVLIVFVSFVKVLICNILLFYYFNMLFLIFEVLWLYFLKFCYLNLILIWLTGKIIFIGYGFFNNLSLKLDICMNIKILICNFNKLF